MTASIPNTNARNVSDVVFALYLASLPLINYPHANSHESKNSSNVTTTEGVCAWEWSLHIDLACLALVCCCNVRVYEAKHSFLRVVTIM